MDLAIILVHVYMYLLSQVTIDNYQAFISSSVADNKPKVLIFSSNQHPSLPHLLVAMKQRFFTSVGFVTTTERKNNKLIKDLGITVANENILLYKEDQNKPFAQHLVSLCSAFYVSLHQCWEIIYSLIT